MEATLRELLPALKPFAAASSFNEQAKICAQVACGIKTADDAAAVAEAAGTPAESLDALIALFLEAARVGVSSEELSGALGGVLPADRAKAVAALATEGQPTMRSALETLTHGPAELVDVRWQRATIAAAGRELPRPGGTPLYTVTLTTRSPDGSTRPLQFSASIEELSDLVRELKCCMRSIERECS